MADCATLPPSTPLRGDGSAQRTLSLGVEPAALPSPLGGSGRRLVRERPEKEIGLRERLAQVYRDLEMANSEVEALKPSAEYHGMRFQNADHELREAIHKREVSGQSYTLFELYDARVEAGHAWNPYRKKLSEAMNWRKSLMDEAASLNKELGT